MLQITYVGDPQPTLQQQNFILDLWDIDIQLDLIESLSKALKKLIKKPPDLLICGTQVGPHNFEKFAQLLPMISTIKILVTSLSTEAIKGLHWGFDCCLPAHFGILDLRRLAEIIQFSKKLNSRLINHLFLENAKDESTVTILPLSNIVSISKTEQKVQIDTTLNQKILATLPIKAIWNKISIHQNFYRYQEEGILNLDLLEELNAETKNKNICVTQNNQIIVLNDRQTAEILAYFERFTAKKL